MENPSCWCCWWPGAAALPVKAEEMRAAPGPCCHGRVLARSPALLAHQLAHGQSVARRRAWRSRTRTRSGLRQRRVRHGHRGVVVLHLPHDLVEREEEMAS